MKEDKIIIQGEDEILKYTNRELCPKCEERMLEYKGGEEQNDGVHIVLMKCYACKTFFAIEIESQIMEELTEEELF